MLTHSRVVGDAKVYSTQYCFEQKTVNDRIASCFTSRRGVFFNDIYYVRISNSQGWSLNVIKTSQTDGWENETNHRLGLITVINTNRDRIQILKTMVKTMCLETSQEI